MRYWNVPNATFVDWNGVPQAVKDLREVVMAPPPGQRAPKFSLAQSCLGFQYLPLKEVETAGASTFLDEVASRPDVYGADREGDSYLIFEMNMDAITSGSFDFAWVRRLVVPRREG